MNLKEPAGVEILLRLAKDADAVIEGFRPGMMERLGIGPEACKRANPALVYGRVTGWGQYFTRLFKSRTQAEWSRLLAGAGYDSVQIDQLRKIGVLT